MIFPALESGIQVSNEKNPIAAWRDPRLARTILSQIRRLAVEAGRPLRFMEVCGTHTMSAARAGLHDLLPNSVRLSSGPGCPVCVTSPGFIAAAVDLSRDRRITIATFGDLVRVPGAAAPAHRVSLERARASGAGRSKPNSCPRTNTAPRSATWRRRHRCTSS
ncbi:MAG: hypothetical protein AAB229_08785 [Candidatus Hydrogenedentota bacterium]